jgi:hypothetical protein
MATSEFSVVDSFSEFQIFDDLAEVLPVLPSEVADFEKVKDKNYSFSVDSIEIMSQDTLGSALDAYGASTGVVHNYPDLIGNIWKNPGKTHPLAQSINTIPRTFSPPQQAKDEQGGLTTLFKNGWIGQDQSTDLFGSLQGADLKTPVRCTCLQCSLPPVDPRRIVPQPEILNGLPLPALDLGQTFLLNSLPGANHTIYLDFNGHTTTGTAWNNSYGSTIVTPAFDFDGNTAAFSNAELERIQYIWQRVVEDFSPFNVNVTTQEPTLDRLIKSSSTDTAWGVRVAIGGSSYDWFNQGAGGVAYLGSFNWNSDTPTYVFTQQLAAGNEKYTAEAISHEVGHTLGLYHDGRTSPSEGYYSGHGSGETGWAPIMGIGYYQNLTQWSKGQYLSANNTEDDLAIITSQNGFGYKVDDTGSTLGTANPLTVSGTAVSANGIIERNSDVDFFSFTTGAGVISLAIAPSGRSPNLDILAELYNAAGTLVATSNPTDLLAASISATVSAGTYYLKVDGVGKGDPLGTGYTDYGSLGQYAITGTIISGNAPPTLAIAVTNATQTEGNTGSKAFTFTVTRSGNTSGANTANWAVTGNGTNPANATDFANNTLPSGTVSFAAGETSKVITVNVQGDTTVEQNETFAVTLSNPTNGATLTTASATGSITNDDVALPAITLAVSPASVLENGTANLVYTFTRTGSTTAPLTVNYTIGGTADGNDYSGATPGTGKTITFTAGSPTVTLTIDPTADSTVEANETVALTLTSGSNYTIGTPAAVTGTITNDDTPPTDQNLYFNVIINDSLNIYSAYHSLITTTLQASGRFWDDYIEGFDVDLDVIVNFNSSIPRATGRSVTSSFVRNNGTYNIFDQGAAAEIKTGVDPNGTAPDIEIEFNPNYLINELWFDSDPLRLFRVQGDKPS